MVLLIAKGVAGKDWAGIEIVWTFTQLAPVISASAARASIGCARSGNGRVPTMPLVLRSRVA